MCNGDLLWLLSAPAPSPPAEQPPSPPGQAARPADVPPVLGPDQGSQRTSDSMDQAGAQAGAATRARGEADPPALEHTMQQHVGTQAEQLAPEQQSQERDQDDALRADEQQVRGCGKGQGWPLGHDLQCAMLKQHLSQPTRHAHVHRSQALSGCGTPWPRALRCPCELAACDASLPSPVPAAG